jgi:ubiquinone/menaquinone biosynthesis C-methylase UbiE
LTFVCPRCRGSLAARRDTFDCAACGLVFPIVCGIADFRLEPDPYIGLEDDRRKAERLSARGQAGTFEDLLRHYYAVTPEDPPDLAARWIPRALAEPEIARALLEEQRLARPGGLAIPPEGGSDRSALLDVGCSTGGLLIAAHGSFETLVGVDVALRWLAVGLVRLREAGVSATLVCANAEHLPFPPASFAALTATDTIEHVRDAGAALSEMHRVAAPGARLLATANNRLAPLPEPNLHLWGVPQLPRAWQAAYVRWRRGDLHPYRIRLGSARELRALARDAGFEDVRVAPGPLLAPHAPAGTRRMLARYNRARTAPIIASLLTAVGPKLVLTAAASSRPSP